MKITGQNIIYFILFLRNSLDHIQIHNLSAIYWVVHVSLKGVGGQALTYLT